MHGTYFFSMAATRVAMLIAAFGVVACTGGIGGAEPAAHAREQVLGATDEGTTVSAQSGETPAPMPMPEPRQPGDTSPPQADAPSGPPGTAPGGAPGAQPNAPGPLAPAPAPADISEWPIYRNDQYGFALRYPPAYAVAVGEGVGQAALVARVSFNEIAGTSPRGPLLLTQFTVEVYDNAAQLTLDEWLAGIGLHPDASRLVREPVQIGGSDGVRLTDMALLAPNTFYYAAQEAFVYRFIPLGPFSGQMLSSVQFLVSGGAEAVDAAVAIAAEMGTAERSEAVANAEEDGVVTVTREERLGNAPRRTPSAAELAAAQPMPMPTPKSGGPGGSTTDTAPGGPAGTIPGGNPTGR